MFETNFVFNVLKASSTWELIYKRLGIENGGSLNSDTNIYLTTVFLQLFFFETTINVQCTVLGVFWWIFEKLIMSLLSFSKDLSIMSVYYVNVSWNT